MKFNNTTVIAHFTCKPNATLYVWVKDKVLYTMSEPVYERFVDGYYDSIEYIETGKLEHINGDLTTTEVHTLTLSKIGKLHTDIELRSLQQALKDLK